MFNRWQKIIGQCNIKRKDPSEMFNQWQVNIGQYKKERQKAHQIHSEFCGGSRKLVN